MVKRLKEYAVRSLEKGAIAIFLIGSLAKGDYTAFSDADVVVIVRDDYPKGFIDRISDFIDPTLPIDIEPRVYTVSEFFKLIQSKSRIVEEVLRYGVPLAGDPNVVKELVMSVSSRGQ
ncbi:MAG: nucleotidyltransferase domain-containing protein [Sulfolobales archaeon]